jgi:hypothetical protein
MESTQDKRRSNRKPLAVREYYGTDHISRICMVAPRTVAKWVDSGTLAGFRIPGSSHRRITHEALMEFLVESKIKILPEFARLLGQPSMALDPSEAVPDPIRPIEYRGGVAHFVANKAYAEIYAASGADLVTLGVFCRDKQLDPREYEQVLQMQGVSLDYYYSHPQVSDAAKERARELEKAS